MSEHRTPRPPPAIRPPAARGDDAWDHEPVVARTPAPAPVRREDIERRPPPGDHVRVLDDRPAAPTSRVGVLDEPRRARPRVAPSTAPRRRPKALPNGYRPGPSPLLTRAGIGIAVLGVLLVGFSIQRGDGRDLDAAAGDTADTTTSTAPLPSTTTTSTLPPGPPAAQTFLGESFRITGDISPKSVVASGHGHVFAQNMMYTHTVTAYAADGTLEATISDSVDLAAFGIDGHPGTSQGAPVETAFTHDGRYAYVSNYSMYGSGFGPEGEDSCTPESGYDDSFVYRVDTETMAIDQVIPVGSVPKYVAVTPDDSTVLVTNWCTWDMSIIDVATATEVARVPIGRYPRGVVVSPDGSTAWVAAMGSDIVVRVDLATREVVSLGSFGDGPRHLLLSPDGSTLYVSHNRSGTVVSIDTATGAETHRVTTGSQPRSMAISADGTAIYVANYDSSTMTKLNAADLTEIDEVGTDHHPIGITYEPTTRTVWVACYGGSILVFRDDATS